MFDALSYSPDPFLHSLAAAEADPREPDADGYMDDGDGDEPQEETEDDDAGEDDAGDED